jgi:hypothetical protein
MKKRGTRTLLIAFPLAIVCCLNGAAQTQSPSDLIRFLTYQSDRPDKQLAEMGIVSCGSTGDLEAARNLAKQASRDSDRVGWSCRMPESTDRWPSTASGDWSKIQGSVLIGSLATILLDEHWTEPLRFRSV